MIFACPKDGWLIIDDEWMPGESLKCPWCKTIWGQSFGAPWDDGSGENEESYPVES